MKYKLSDVVDRINGNVDRFTTSLEYYVGGEHFESNELEITGCGLIKPNVNILGFKFHFAFQPGDVLYMARNPHLRKAGMVNFSGICSDASYILRTKDSNVLCQEYLAVIMQSNHLWDYCESHKVGSVNFAINWKTLANYEFDLPDINIQRSIANRIWAAYRVKQAYKKLISATDEMVKSQFIEMFGNPISNDRNWDYECINSVAPESPAAHVDDDQVWLLNLDMIESNTGNIIDKLVVPKSEVLSAQPFDDGNVLFSKLRPYLNKVVYPKDKGYATTELVPLRPNQDKLNKVFFTYLLRSDQFVQFANDISGGTKMPRMPLKELREFKCILPPINLQERFAEIVRQADKSKFELKRAIEAIDKVIKSLING